MYCINGFLLKIYRRDPHDNSTIFAFFVQAICMSGSDLQFESCIETVLGQVSGVGRGPCMELRQECLRGVIPSSRGSSVPVFVLRVSYASSVFFFHLGIISFFHHGGHLLWFLSVSSTIYELNTLSHWAWKL